MEKILDMIKGKDGNYSLRRVLAVIAFYKLISCSDCPTEYSMILASLIAALLALTTWQTNILSKDNVQPNINPGE